MESNIHKHNMPTYDELLQSLKEANDTTASLLNLYTMAEGARIALVIELQKLKSK